MPKLTAPFRAEHVLGLDLGTTNLRLQVAHYDGSGRLSGGPSGISLGGADHDGALPTVLELDSGGNVRQYGKPALLSANPSRTIVSEFKPCIGQAEEDLNSQGRPDNARFCKNPKCLQPGWAWSVAMQYCGFCGAALPPAGSSGQRWKPTFRYSQDEALSYAQSLLETISARLTDRLGEPISRSRKWAVVAGVPVHWQAHTLDRYENVIQKAFPDAEISLMHEPAGALRFYGQRGLLTHQESTRPWTLVVDFGGGTTDLVLARVETSPDSVNILDIASYGERYGGADFDLMLAHYAAGLLDVSLDGGLLAQWRLKSREWKEAFSSQVDDRTIGGASVEVAFPVPRGDESFKYEIVTLDQQVFEQVAADLVERFRSVLERALRHFGRSPNEIGQVVLTGGGAHWYFVQEAVKDLIPGANLLTAFEPERAISMGLSLAGLRHEAIVSTSTVSVAPPIELAPKVETPTAAANRPPAATNAAPEVALSPKSNVPMAAVAQHATPPPYKQFEAPSPQTPPATLKQSSKLWLWLIVAAVAVVIGVLKTVPHRSDDAALPGVGSGGPGNPKQQPLTDNQVKEAGFIQSAQSALTNQKFDEADRNVKAALALDPKDSVALQLRELISQKRADKLHADAVAVIEARIHDVGAQLMKVVNRPDGASDGVTNSVSFDGITMTLTTSQKGKTVEVSTVNCAIHPTSIIVDGPFDDRSPDYYSAKIRYPQPVVDYSTPPSTSIKDKEFFFDLTSESDAQKSVRLLRKLLIVKP